MPTDCSFPDENRPFFTCHPGLTALLLIFGLGLVALTTYSVLTRSLLFAYDQPLAAMFKADVKTLPPAYLTFSTWFANFGSVAPNLICLIFAYLFLRRKCDDRFTLILASYGIGVLIFFLLALAINRPRPSLPGLLASMPFPSFPSGHMIQTLTLLVPLLYLYVPRVRSAPTRAVILLAAFIYLAAIAIDRLFVNAHYLTDVLAGLGIGIAWSVIVLLLFERYHLRAGSRRRRYA